MHSPSQSGRRSRACAKVATERSITRASRTLTGVTSILSDGAADCIAPNWPVPDEMAASRKNGNPGNEWRDLLEQLKVFPSHAVFQHEKPVALPPGCAMLSTKPAPTGSTTPTNTTGMVRVACKSDPRSRRRRQNDIRRERGQFYRVSANVGRIARPKAIVDLHVATVGSSPIAPTPAKKPRSGPSCLHRRRLARTQITPMRRTGRPCCHAPQAATQPLPPRRVA